MSSTTSDQQQKQQKQQKQKQQQQQEKQLHEASEPDAIPLHFQSATALASRIRRGEITSLELTRHFVKRIEELDGPSVNAVVVRCFEAALERAAALDRVLQESHSRALDVDVDVDADADVDALGPLHGVPITVKENNDVRYLRTTLANPLLADRPPSDRHSPAVQRLIDAGAVVLGKTNLPLGCNDVQTYNAIWGATSNPFCSGRTPGGSSGGSAASLCAGFSALELGGDIGGSIRVPAALCGVFGHKPTLGAIPTRWAPSRSPDIVCKGPMARTAADLEVALKVLVGSGPEGPAKRAWSLKLPAAAATRLNDFCVAIWEDDPCCPVDSDVRAALGNLGETLRAAGCTVADDRPLRDAYGWKGGSERAFAVYKCLLAAEENLELDEQTVETTRNALFRYGRDDDDDDDDDDEGSQRKRERTQQAKWITQSTQSWHKADAARQEMRATYERFFERYDVLVCPVTVCAAWTKDESGAGPHEWTEPHSVRWRDGVNDKSDDNDNDNDKNDDKCVQHFWQIGNRILRGANGHTVPYHDQVFWSGVTNVCGNPSTAFPAGMAASSERENGHELRPLPIGLQAVGAEWCDLTTIAFAKALEDEVGCRYRFVPPGGY